MTDAQLALRSQVGDREAFATLARRWQGRLVSFLRSATGSDEEALDLCQETLLRAFLNIHRLRRPEQVKSWLYSIALNLSRDRGRRLQKMPQRAIDEELSAQLAAPDADPLERAEIQNLSTCLRDALAELPEEQRSAILLRELGDLNSSEIAEISGVPAATVRSRIYYGFKTLRRSLVARGLDPLQARPRQGGHHE